VKLAVGMPKSELGGARNLQWVQCNDWRIAIPGYVAIIVLKPHTIKNKTSWTLFSNLLTITATVVLVIKTVGIYCPKKREVILSARAIALLW